MGTGVEKMKGEKETDTLNDFIFFGKVDLYYVIDKFQNFLAHFF
jgi:hypothetical protein